ncbi:MAG: hypothetical protein WD267_09175 [Balneolales bacterium]
MMKRLLPLLIYILFFVISASGQKTQTLFGSGVKHGVYGAPVFGITSINGQSAYLRGTRGAWIINISDQHTVNVGLGSYRTRSDFEPVLQNDIGENPLDMRSRYGGLEIEYLNRTYRLLHVGIQALIGTGTVNYRNASELITGRTSDSYFVMKPGVNLNLNVTTWFRISGGLLYRYASGVNLNGTSDSELSGITSFATLRFGKF